MTDLAAQFAAAADDVQKLPTKPNNETMLTLYALYKQVTAGDVAGSRPGMFDLVGRAKYDAWAAVRGVEREEAMQRYIDLVAQLRSA